MKMGWVERTLWLVLGALLTPDERRDFLADLMEEAEARSALGLDAHGPRWLRRQLAGSIPAVFSRWAGLTLRSFTDDLVQALRALRGGRSSTALVVSVLGIGLAMSAVVFAVMNAVLLSPLPYPDAGSLYMVKTVQPLRSPQPRGVSGPDFFDYQEALGERVRLGAFDHTVSTLTGSDAPAVRLDVAAVSRVALEMTHATPLLGRTFSADEDGAEPHRVAILQEGLWRDRFGADPAILGRSVDLDGATHTVVGVLPSDYALPDPEVAVWTPLGESPRGLHRRAPVLDVVVRVPNARALSPLSDRLADVAGRLATEHPTTNEGRTVLLVPLVRDLAGQDGRALPVLMAVALCLLLVAFVNAFGLLFARTIRRMAEFELRGALGAGRARVARQLALEATLQVTAGLVLATGLAGAGLAAARRLWPADMFRAGAIEVDGSVLLFVSAAAFIMAALATPFLALVPSRGNTAHARGARSHLRVRTRSAILAIQVAAAVALVGGATVLLRAYLATTTIDRGVDVDRLLVAEVALPSERYPTGMARYPDWPEVHRFHGDILNELAADPSIETVALAGSNPLSGPGFRIGVGLLTAASVDTVEASIQMVSAAYRQVLGLDLLAGRDLDPGDTADGEAVTLVNEAFWHAFLGGGPGPWGAVEFLGSERRIVGIVENAVPAPGVTTWPAVLSPMTQTPSEWFSIIARTRRAPADAVGSIRAASASVDPDVAVHAERPLTRVLDSSLARPRLHSGLLALFSGVTVILAAVGLFALLMELVESRRDSLGVRLALGARPPAIIGHVLSETLFALGIGLGAGGLVAWIGVGYLRTLIPDATALDPSTVAAAASVLLVAGVSAALVPVVRALRIDPARSLRAE